MREFDELKAAIEAGGVVRFPAGLGTATTVEELKELYPQARAALDTRVAGSPKEPEPPVDIQAIEAAHADELDAIKADVEAGVAQLKERHAQEVAGLKDSHLAALGKIDSEHADAIAKLKEKHKAESDKLKEEVGQLKGQLAELKKKPDAAP